MKPFIDLITGKTHKQTNDILWQIYGELNRLRLSGVSKARAKRIMDFDAKYNNYIPFFDHENNFENYKAIKTKEIGK